MNSYSRSNAELEVLRCKQELSCQVTVPVANSSSEKEKKIMLQSKQQIAKFTWHADMSTLSVQNVQDLFYFKFNGR
jgi:hypothetical protein